MCVVRTPSRFISHRFTVWLIHLCWCYTTMWHFHCQCPSQQWQAKITFWRFIRSHSLSLFIIYSLKLCRFSLANIHALCIGLAPAKKKMCLNFPQDNFVARIVCSTSYRSCKLQWPEKCFWQSWQNYFIWFSCGSAFLLSGSTRLDAMFCPFSLRLSLVVQLKFRRICNTRASHTHTHIYICIKCECNHGKSISM